MKYNPTTNPGVLSMKYVHGTNACRNCQRAQHKKCRPRLDGTLCSCTCEWAEINRNLHEDLSKGTNLTVRETLSPFFPRVCTQTSRFTDKSA